LKVWHKNGRFRVIPSPAFTNLPWQGRGRKSPRPSNHCAVLQPFPTRTTKAALVFGRVTPETPLTLASQMAENGVIFSDGIEKDFLEFNSGTKAVIGIAEMKGALVE
jgi:hypothetical protein